MAIEKLRKMQLGRESSAGTAVAATAVWRGPAAKIVDAVERTLVNENIGYLVQTDRGYFPMKSATLAMPETEATFEQLPHVFEAGIRTDTPAANGDTLSAYIYEYIPSLTAGETIKTYTIETGDDQEQYEMEYAFVRDFTLSGAPNQAVMLSSNWVGRQKTACDFTTPLTPPTVEEILFNKAKLYLDPSGGTLGSTQKTNTWLGFTINFTSGWQAQSTGSGNLYFSFLKNTGPEITGSLTLEYDAVGEAMEDAYAAGTTYLMRMALLGSAVGTGGTHATKLVWLDHAIQITGVADDAQDGNDVITLNWKAVYNTGATLFAKYTVVNLLSSIP